MGSAHNAPGTCLPPYSTTKRQVCPAACQRSGTAKQTRTNHAAQEMIPALGDPIKGRRLGIHTLWSLACLPAEEQLNRIEAIAR